MENQDLLGFYDLIIHINAMKSLLGNGWEEEFSIDGKKVYEKRKINLVLLYQLLEIKN